MVNVSVASVIEAVADVRGSRLAILQGGRRRTWHELDERAARLATWFVDRGVSEGDLVGVAARNSIEHLESLLALTKIRATPFNINYRYGATEVDQLLAQFEAKGVVVDADLVTASLTEVLDSRGIAVRLAVGPVSSQPSFETVEAAVGSSRPHPRIARAADGWIIFTGGTTGVPRPVRFTHRRFLGRAIREHVPEAKGLDAADFIDRLLDDALPRTESYVTYVAPPMIHATGLLSALTTLLMGGAVVLPSGRSFDAGEVIESIDDFAVTELALVGDAFARPLVSELEDRAKRGRGSNLATLETVVSVGAPWSADVKARLLAHVDARLIDMVSSSEGGPFVRGITSLVDGRVGSHVELAPGARLLDEADRDVTPGSGTVGVLAAPVSDDVGYFDTRASDAYRTIDGVRYCIPGDRAILEADGQVRLLGRGARVINTGGEKVHAEEVEAVLAEHPRIEGATVVGVPHPRWGQTVAAVVAVPDGTPLSLTEVQHHVASRLAGYKKPRFVRTVPELRVTEAGKPDLAWAREVLGSVVDGSEVDGSERAV